MHRDPPLLHRSRSPTRSPPLQFNAGSQRLCLCESPCRRRSKGYKELGVAEWLNSDVPCEEIAHAALNNKVAEHDGELKRQAHLVGDRATVLRAFAARCWIRWECPRASPTQRLNSRLARKSFGDEAALEKTISLHAETLMFEADGDDFAR